MKEKHIQRDSCYHMVMIYIMMNSGAVSKTPTTTNAFIR